jgi:hypothetical protein
VGVAGDELDAGQAAGDQVGEERVPRRTGLGRGDLDAEDLTVPVVVDPGRHEHDRVDHASVLADLHRERVGGHEGERPRVGERSGAERGHLLVEVGSHPRDLRLRQRRDPQRRDELVHPPRGDTEEVAGRHHADQCRFGTLPALEQPVGEVRAGAELGDRDVDRADPGIQLAVPVAVSGVHPLRIGLAVIGATHRVRVSGEQRVDHRGQQRAQQIRRRVGQALLQQGGRVENVRSGHRDGSFRGCCETFTRRITRWPLPRPDDMPGEDHADRVTPLSGTQLISVDPRVPLAATRRFP